jgi:hypothetical protein
MNNSDVKKITLLLANKIRVNIDRNGHMYNINTVAPDVYRKCKVNGLCNLCDSILPSYGYTLLDARLYIREIRKYAPEPNLVFLFTPYNFDIRLQFLDHVDACLTQNVIKRFNCNT